MVLLAGVSAKWINFDYLSLTSFEILPYLFPFSKVLKRILIIKYFVG